MESDVYKTIATPAKGLFKDKGSRFIAFAYPVSSVEEIKSLIENNRKEYHDARHHCYAYMLGQDRQTWRVNDDGEPSGTAGKPILGQINSAELTNILIIVIRYFGGTLLGVSGLINAYRSAAADALAGSEMVEKNLYHFYEVTFPYSSMNDLMKILKEEEISQSSQVFQIECRMIISFRALKKERVLNRISRVEGIQYRFIETK
jgi:uncharacterized YigZ family protein